MSWEKGQGLESTPWETWQWHMWHAKRFYSRGRIPPNRFVRHRQYTDRRDVKTYRITLGTFSNEQIHAD